MEEKILKKDHFGFYNFKIVLVGDSAVGKTSLIKRYVFNEWKFDYKATIGSNIFIKDLNFNNDEEIKVKLNIWDIAGQQVWEVMRPVYYMGANGIICVYDVTNESSYNNLLSKWYAELKDLIKKVKIVILGNKIDLGDKNFAKDDELKAKFNNDITHVKTSAKEGKNVEHAFELLVKDLLNMK